MKKSSNIVVPFQYSQRIPLKAYKVSLGALCGFCIAHSSREASRLFYVKDYGYHRSYVKSPTTLKELRFHVERYPELDSQAKEKEEASILTFLPSL